MLPRAKLFYTSRLGGFGRLCQIDQHCSGPDKCATNVQYGVLYNVATDNSDTEADNGYFCKLSLEINPQPVEQYVIFGQCTSRSVCVSAQSDLRASPSAYLENTCSGIL